MAIRHVAAAALFVCAGAAYADPISTAAPAAGLLNSWTASNGTDVLGSGVLGSTSLNLVGGVSHSSSAKDVSLVDVLFGKAAANVGTVNGQTQLFFSRGIEGDYLLASGHGILAATLGQGKSVVGSANGAVIIDGVVVAPIGGATGSVGAGAGSAGSGSSGAGNTGSGSSGSGNTGSGNSGSGNTGSGNAGSGNTGSGNSGSGDAGSGNGSAPFIPGGQDEAPVGGGIVGGGGQVLPGPAAIDPAAIPEPSSIALMLAGMLGAGALSRRRKQ